MAPRFKRICCVVFVVVAILVAAPAQAALDAFMRVVGAQQGTIEGNATKAGQEGAFEVNEIHHLTTAGESGADHQPLIVTTALGKGIPPLLQALENGENLAIELKLYQPSPTGAQENFYTFELHNARLVTAEPISPDNKNPDLMQYAPRIRLRFEFDVMVHNAVLAGESVEL